MPRINERLFVLANLGLAATALLMLSCGSVTTAIVKARDTADRQQSKKNLHLMMIGVHNCATNTTVGDIPPSYGPFPRGANKPQSFFVSLLPYIERGKLAMNWEQNTTTPIDTYIAPTDSHNPGTSGLISYATNGNVLQPATGLPGLPNSFFGRTSTVIVIFERTAKGGATWSSSNSYLTDRAGNSSPEFGDPALWSQYATKATALTEDGCWVGMGDASARVVTQSNANAGWAWAMNPVNAVPQPAGW